MSTAATMRGLVLLGVLLVALGCGGNRPVFGEFLSRGNAYDYKGERVELRMLDRMGLWNYASGQAWEHDYHKRLTTTFPKLFKQAAKAPGRETERATLESTEFKEAVPIVGAAIPLIAGFAVDAVKGELERLANIHEAQFGASINGYGYWENLDFANKEGRPHYLGFVIERYTANHSKSPAFRMVCALVPSSFMAEVAGTPPADARIFVIQPIVVQITAAKAKVFEWDRKLNSSVMVSLGATWIDENQVVHQEDVAKAQFDVGEYDLTTSSPKFDGLGVAGWFGGVPVSINIKKDNYTGNGNFKLAVAVTEKDPSRMKEVIERAAKYVGENKAKVVEYVTP